MSTGIRTVIRNAKIIDGTGTPAYVGELLIEGERIVSISSVPNALTGDMEIDANGLVLAPGFIDYMSHTLLPLFIDKRSLSKVVQGVTTEIMGEGATPAPFGGKCRNLLEVYGQHIPKEWVERSHSWARFSDWLEDVAKDGVGVNIGSFVGGGTLREYVKGMAMGECTPSELEALRQVSREVMEDGAFGVAFALLYPPDSYANTAELIEVCKAIEPYGGIYVTHIRDESNKLIPSLEEAVLIGKTANVPIHIYHLKVCGEENFALMPEALKLLRQAQQAGLDVTADLYPYRAAGTSLESAMPPWVAEDDRMVERLRDPVTRAKVRAELIEPSGDWEQLIQRPENTVTVTFKLPEHQRFVGKSLAEICELRGDAHWADT